MTTIHRQFNPCTLPAVGGVPPFRGGPPHQAALAEPKHNWRPIGWKDDPPRPVFATIGETVRFYVRDSREVDDDINMLRHLL